ncbi:holo-ACP synthase [Pyxidicoccus sp. 3LG]
MSPRVGCDLVALGRLERLLADEDFTRRVFHPVELEDCEGRKDRLAALGGRFAAKEAMVKALGTGLITGGVFPRDVWVRRDPEGRPRLEYAPHVSERLARLGCASGEVSISHDGDYAMATVLLF